MWFRFCLYSIFKNLRPFEAYFVLFLIAPVAVGGAALNLLNVGLLVGYQKLLSGFLEIPSGVLSDRWGRRRSLALCFAFYVVAFPMFGLATQLGAVNQLVLLYVGQTFFGLGEALRTGSHKAIMLDWVDQHGEDERGATRLLGWTRLCSKTTSGLSALLGGVLIVWGGAFAMLFWLATVPAMAGVLLILSYPTSLEGEHRRDASGKRPSFFGQFTRIWAIPGMAVLMLQSVLFESQIKLSQHYIQPLFENWLGLHQRSVVGAWVLLIGVYYLVQDLLGGAASAMSSKAEKRLAGRRLIVWLYVLVVVGVATITASLFYEFWAGVVGAFILLAIVQNLRRPVFVSQFNRVMDKPQRATTLSIESQSRTWAVGIMAPVTGFIADLYGLPWAFAVVLGVLVLGLWLAPTVNREGG